MNELTAKKAHLTPELQIKLEILKNTRTGAVEYGFTNDYMFRAVLQRNSAVLTEIVRILLGIPKEEDIVCEIMNPIILGESLREKDCILDIRVMVNGKVRVNLEMQMTISPDWTKRSIYYGCRLYADLKAGQDYSDCQPTVHIGFLKKSPFSDDQRFYSNYVLKERETNRIYSGDFQISMVNLEQIEHATAKDRESGLYDWIRLFVATQWEELSELAAQTEGLGQALVTLAELTEEEKIRQQCEARRMFEMDQSVLRRHMQKTEKRLAEIEQEIKVKEQEIKAKDQEIKTKEYEINAKDQEIKAKDEEIQKQERYLALAAALTEAGRYEELQTLLNCAAQDDSDLLEEFQKLL